MKISLSALALGGLGAALVFADWEQGVGFVLFLAAVLVGLAGMVNAAVARSLTRGTRIAAFAIAALPPAALVYFAIAFVVAANNGAFD